MTDPGRQRYALFSLYNDVAEACYEALHRGR